MAARACARLALPLVALALFVAAPAAADPPGELRTASPNQRWTLVVEPNGAFELARRRRSPSPTAPPVAGRLPQAPREVAVLDEGGFVAVDTRDARGVGEVLTLVDAAGRTWARFGLADLFGPAAVDAFWAPDGDQIAWRVDWWVDQGASVVVLIPDAPGQPVAVSLTDGLVENPDPEVYVTRMERSGLWFASRLRALELVAASSPEPAGFIPALRRIVREQEAPLLLRLRAAAILDQHGDSTGRSLVLLTARATGTEQGLTGLPPEELRRLPEPERPCDLVPPPANDRPYDQQAARSYAIRLLPTVLGAEAAPLLGELLAGQDEQDRFDSLQAIACLAAQEPGTTDALVRRVHQRHAREARRLGAITRLVPLGDSAVPAELRQQARSLDVDAAAEAIEALLLRSPASNPTLLGLLEAGGSGDVRIAEHLVQRPDSTAIGPLLVALARYRDVEETAGVMTAALRACLPTGEQDSAPSALDIPSVWLEWGDGWRRRQQVATVARILVGLLPLVVLIGVTRRRG
jgi:hypothetical protein